MRYYESPYEKLDKILAYEERRGCDDGAIIGGLASYIHRWVRETRPLITSEDEGSRLEAMDTLLSAYGEKSPDERRHLLVTARHLLAELKPLWRPPEPKAEAVADQGEDGLTDRVEASVSTVQPPTADSLMGVGQAERPQERRPPRPLTGIDVPVTTLPGVNRGYAECLARLGVHTIRDLLYLFPRRYNDYSRMKKIAELSYGLVETVVATVWEVHTNKVREGLTITEAVVVDETGTMKAVWFNQPYLARTFQPGTPVVLSGRVDIRYGRKSMSSPEYETLDKDELIHTGRLVPVYPLTEGIGARWLRRLQKRVVDHYVPHLPDHLPPAVREGAHLVDLPTALAQIHFPDAYESIDRARERLAFDEFLFLQIGLWRRRRLYREASSIPLTIEPAVLQGFIQHLPFGLTGAQERVLGEILQDMAGDRPMVRLLQGDVGSGKTVVAALAMLVAIANGCQAAIMVPTEILARQHYQTVIRLIAGIARHQGADSLTVERLNAIIRDVDNDTLPDVVVIPDVPLGAGRVRPVCVARLVGSLNDSTKHVLHQRIAEGEVDIAIGTHALIQEAVSFARLGLAIVDEQHRFGVLQRAALRSKGKGEGTSPHVLVMTATPIPRTLALTLYGDLDISVLDQMPPGRLPVKTKVLDPSEKERAYTFIRRQVEQGHQAFVICPLIEESEALDEVRAATEEYERLQREVFPDLKVGLLHGRMKQVEKDEVMDRFRRNEINVLVSTAVVEVGIDVPNATVILIEGAERFGLAQLHQFRGRVRRSQAPSYCILLPTRKGEAVEERLQPMESINDGLALADLDLQQRGMGELLGTLQSGHEVTLKMARLSDVGILERARAAAQAILQEDPMLARPEHRLLAQQVAAFWHIEEEGSGDIS